MIALKLIQGQFVRLAQALKVYVYIQVLSFFGISPSVLSTALCGSRLTLVAFIKVVSTPQIMTAREKKRQASIQETRATRIPK